MVLFDEVYMARFTTATTCYTRACHFEQDVSDSTTTLSDNVAEEDSRPVWSARLATESHILRVHIPLEPPPRSTTTVDEHIIDSATPSMVSDVEDEREIPSESKPPEAQTMAEDPTPVVSNTIRDQDVVIEEAPIVSQTGHSICVGYSHRQNWEALVLLDVLPADSDTITTASPRSSANMGEDTVNVDKATWSSSNSNSKSFGSLLLLQNQRENVFQSKRLDFRALSPSVAILSQTSNIVGVWVGSADDANLNFFYYTKDNISGLQQLDLDQESSLLTFETPVMSIEALKGSSTLSTNLLAIACQDGTVCVLNVTYGFHPISEPAQATGVKIEVQKMYDVIVDGPIACLDLKSHVNGRLDLLIGSLCGYVGRSCRPGSTEEQHAATQQLNQNDSNHTWLGPFLIVEELSVNHQPQQEEDSVLAVYIWDNDKVAIGTQSGRCLLYQMDDDDTETEDNASLVDNVKTSDHLLLWQCQLPYAIHGICHIPYNPPLMTLLITTQMSMHIFQQRQRNYCADTALARLEQLCSQDRSQPQRFPETQTQSDADYWVF